MIRNERGIALVITLLVVTLLAITVIEFAYSAQIDQHMARNALSGLQASLLARSGINLGEAFLLHDDPNAQVDAFTEDWCPDPSPDGHACRIDETNGQVLLPPNMRLRVQIVDEGGKLNLNLVPPHDQTEWNNWRKDPNNRPKNLVARQEALQRLLSSRGGVDAATAEQIVERLNAFWEDRILGTVSSGGTAKGPTPHPTAGTTAAQPVVPIDPQRLQQQGFASLDDASIIGLTPSMIRRLRPVLTALPLRGVSKAQQGVNINTAPVEVLRAILGDDGGIVDDIIAQRSEAPLKAVPQGNLTPAAGMLGTRSFYFLVRASGVVNPNPITGRGGIGRSASMLVERRPAGQRTGSASAVPWILKQLEWQKEGGAVLFLPQGDQEPGADEQVVPGAPG